MNHSTRDRNTLIKDRVYILRVLGLIWKKDAFYVALTVFLLLLENAGLYAVLLYCRDLFNALSGFVQSAGKTTELIKESFLAAVAVTVVYTLVRIISAFFTDLLGVRLSEIMDKMIHDKAVELDMSFYDSPEYFDTLFRARQAGTDRPHVVLLNLLSILKNIAGLTVISVFAFQVSVWLIPILILLVAPAMLVRIYFSKKLLAWRLKHSELERKAGYFSWLLTDNKLAKEIKTYNLGPFFREQYMTIRHRIHQKKIQNSRYQMLFELVTSLLAVLGGFFVLGFLVRSALSGNIGYGDITMVVMTIPQAYNQVQALSQNISALYDNNKLAGYLFRFLALSARVSEDTGKPIPREAGASLTVRGLRFAYPGSFQPVLQGIDLEIPAGKVTAVVGLNGAGKSTLIKLLLRLYEPDGGAIYLNGEPVTRYSEHDYRKLFGVVFQDFGQYHSTLAENIAYGDIELAIDNLRAEACLAKANGSDILHHVQHGLSTQLGKAFTEGTDLSTGQWQKLAIARAFYRDSLFVLLDEATSAVDAISEHQLVTDLRKRLEGRGALIISHRLTTVTHADYIYMVEHGRVIEQGTHDELMNLNGAYAMLFAARRTPETEDAIKPLTLS